jgi:hypothetical protein
VKLRFGFTPCPNDAFAFHALVHGLVPAPFEVEPVLLDIEELNQRAAGVELELTKLSFGAAAATGCCVAEPPSDGVSARSSSRARRAPSKRP